MWCLFDRFKKLCVVIVALCAALLNSAPAMAGSVQGQKTVHSKADIMRLYDGALLATEGSGVTVTKRAYTQDFKHINMSLSPKSAPASKILDDISLDLTTTLNAQLGTAQRRIGQTQFWTDEITHTQIGLWRDAGTLSFVIDQRGTNALLSAPRLNARAQGRSVKIIHKSHRKFNSQTTSKIAETPRFRGAD